MKNYLFFFFFICTSITFLVGQEISSIEKVKTTANKKKKILKTMQPEGLNLGQLPRDVSKFIEKGFVCYSDFGAKGNGKTDDTDAIVATHAFANLHGLPVKADRKASYYLGGKNNTAIIQTDTDFGSASFIIDDTEVTDRTLPIFLVNSNLEEIKLDKIVTLKKNQGEINFKFSTKCVISVLNSNVKNYIRFGKNQNNGLALSDIFIVDKNGLIDSSTPIIWDFDQITEMTALPIHEKKLILKGGRFTTIANSNTPVEINLSV